MFSIEEQRNHCLTLAEYLEKKITDDQYTNHMTVIALPDGIKGNALAHAATLKIGGLSLLWVSRKRAIVMKDKAILLDANLLKDVFGKNAQFAHFSRLHRAMVIADLRQMVYPFSVR